MNRENIQEFLTKNVSTLTGVGGKTKKLLKKKTQLAKESIINFTWESTAQKHIDFVSNLVSSSLVHPIMHLP